MPTESELRRQLHSHDDDTPSHGIDLDAVLRGARRRRRPRTIAVTAVASLAVVGIAIPVAIGIAGPQNGTFSAGSAASSPGSKSGLVAPESAQQSGGAPAGASGGAADGGVNQLAPVQKLNLCGGALALVTPAANGLVLNVQPVDAAADTRHIPATVTLTNTGTAAFEGSASPFPVLTLSHDDIVLWHSNGATPQLAQVIDLAAGASISFSTTFEPLVCGARNDSMTTFGDDLPAVGAGSYELSAAMDISDSAGGSVLVTGPTSQVTLR